MVRLPITVLIRALLWAAGIGVLVLLVASGVPRAADNALYDLNMQHWSYAPGTQVVIAAIDARSLGELGRWPWRRSVEAKLLDRLTADGVSGVGMDIILSSPGEPKDDEALATALRRSGKTVLAVSAEPAELGGPVEEMIPIPPLASNAAAFGHVGVALGAGDMARGAYLLAGLGRPHWPSLALAVYELGHAVSNPQLPGLRNPTPNAGSPYLWSRDHYVLVHYAGPAGTFGRVSCADLIDGRIPAALLRGRLVLIGATADGMGDSVLTPDGVMPGVEYQANVLESLLHHGLITPFGFGFQLLIGALLLALPCVLYGLPGLRRAWRAGAVSAAAALVLSIALLRVVGWWWPPAACIATMAIGTAAWTLMERRALPSLQPGVTA